MRTRNFILGYKNKMRKTLKINCGIKWKTIQKLFKSVGMTVLSFRFCPDGRGHSVFGIQSGLWALEWMSQQTCAAFVSLKTVYLPNPNSSFYSPWDLDVHTDGWTDGRTWPDRPAQILITNKYTLYCRKRFLLPVTFFQRISYQRLVGV